MFTQFNHISKKVQFDQSRNINYHENQQIEDEQEYIETDDDISQQILALATPALISLAIDPLMTIADTAFVGRYSAPNDPYPLAGLGSAAALLVFSFYVFNFPY